MSSSAGRDPARPWAASGAGRRRRTDLGVIVALSWLFIAIGGTVVFAGSLGLRGLIWMGVHHVVCVAAVSHEMWRGWKRRKARQAQEAAAAELEGQDLAEALGQPG